MIVKLRISLVLSGFSLFLFTVGCDKQERTGDVAQGKYDMVVSLTDKPLDDYQNKLLDVAFEAASAIPIQPHIKDRSRAQGKVVETSLELDQPLRALRCIEKIDNWRRGAGYADLAFYCAKHGYTGEVQQYLNLAVQISESAEDWHKDHIRMKIANAYTLLGETQQADQYVKDLADVESLKVAKVTAMIANDDHFNEQMKALDALLVSSNFDIVENALKVWTNLFNRFYDNTERRSFVEEKIKTSWDKLPIFKRVELLTDMAGFALDHADQAKALELVNEAQLLMDGAQWRPEHRIPMISKLVKLRFQAGDRQKSRIDAGALLALFDSQRDKIVNIERAGALRPLAEAYQSMGDTATALSAYKRTVEEGVENPNSRPRAEDLSTTCLSMAVHGVEPDAVLWTRIRQINDGLGDPW
jgi:tetratricopeptide (TPR) repeat protein